MGDLITKFCDAPGCSNIKRAANNWFGIATTQRNFECFRKPTETATPVGEFDVCGPACAHTLFGTWLEGMCHTSSPTSGTRDTGKLDTKKPKGDSPSETGIEEE